MAKSATTTTIKQKTAADQPERTVSDRQLDQAFARIAELENAAIAAAAEARRALVAAQAEVERVRSEKAEFEQYDEPTAAEKLGISYSKLAEVRQQKNFARHGLVQQYGTAVRYSGDQLRRIQEFMAGNL